jgi:ATP-dependent Clp protease ATP-binding subunit ClpB
MAANMQFSEKVSTAISDATSLAHDFSNQQIMPLHLASALLNPSIDGSPDTASTATPLFKRVIERADGDLKEFERALNKAIVRLPTQYPAPESAKLSIQFAKVLRAAAELQKTHNDAYLALDHLITALVEDNGIRSCLATAKIADHGRIAIVLQEMRDQIPAKHGTVGFSAEEASRTFTNDMTASAKDGEIDPIIGREKEIREVIRILLQSHKPCPLLVGDPDVGKTSVLHGLASHIANGDIRHSLTTCRLLSLNIGGLVLGIKSPGDVAERMHQVLQDAERSQGVILVIDDLHILLDCDLSEGGSMGTASLLLKLALTRGRLRCIATTTSSEYKKRISSDPVFGHHFQQVPVTELSSAESLTVLRDRVETLEAHHGLRITNDALIVAVDLASKHFPSKSLPSSAINLIDTTAADIRMKSALKPEELANLEHKKRLLRTEIRLLDSGRSTSDTQSSRLVKARNELFTLEEEERQLQQQYENSSRISNEIQGLKNRIDALFFKKEDLGRSNNFPAVAEIQDEIAIQNESLRQLERQRGNAQSETLVGSAQVVATVSHLTGLSTTKIEEKEPTPERVRN